MDPLDPLDQAAADLLRTNQTLVLLNILLMLEDVSDVEEAKARVRAVLDSLTAD